MSIVSPPTTGRVLRSSAVKTTIASLSVQPKAKLSTRATARLGLKVSSVNTSLPSVWLHLRRSRKATESQTRNESVRQVATISARTSSGKTRKHSSPCWRAKRWKTETCATACSLKPRNPILQASILPRIVGSIATATRTNGFVDYHSAYDYTRRILQVIESIAALLKDGHAPAVIELTEYALAQLESAIGDMDDSDGYMNDILPELQDLHHRACVDARPEPRSLARRLFEWEMKSDWEIFYGTAETYADVFGAKGWQNTGGWPTPNGQRFANLTQGTATMSDRAGVFASPA